MEKDKGTFTPDPARHDTVPHRTVRHRRRRFDTGNNFPHALRCTAASHRAVPDPV